MEALPRPKTLKTAEPSAPAASRPEKILTIDIGGSKVKVMVNGQIEPKKSPSGRKLTPSRLITIIEELTRGAEFDAISVGYPGLVGDYGPRSEPGNLGPGWVGFDFATAFGKPVRFMNDAAMQALGSYEGGRMLFLGFGTGLGSALIADNIIVPLELGRLEYKNGQTYGELLGRKGYAAGKNRWRRIVGEIVPMLMASFIVDYVVLGGGNARNLKVLPPGARLGHNLTAFRGGFRLWSLDEIPTHTAQSVHSSPAQPREWRLL